MAALAGLGRSDSGEEEKGDTRTVQWRGSRGVDLFIVTLDLDADESRYFTLKKTTTNRSPFSS